jgi:hypothetical protein
MRLVTLLPLAENENPLLPFCTESNTDGKTVLFYRSVCTGSFFSASISGCFLSLPRLLLVSQKGKNQKTFLAPVLRKVNSNKEAQGNLPDEGDDNGPQLRACSRVRPKE